MSLDSAQVEQVAKKVNEQAREKAEVCCAVTALKAAIRTLDESGTEELYKFLRHRFCLNAEIRRLSQENYERKIESLSVDLQIAKFTRELNG